MSIYDLGFTKRNISSITRRYNEPDRHIHLQHTEFILIRHEKDIGNLIRNCGFSPANISAMLAGSGNQLILAVRDLTSSSTQHSFIKLQQEIGFTSRNISGIITGAGRHAGTVARKWADTDSIQTLQRVQRDLNLKPKTLSSFLHGTGNLVERNLGIVASKQMESTLLELGEIGYTPENLSSMTSQSGSLDERLDMLQENREKLSAMLGMSPADTISYKVYKSAGKSLADKIDSCYTELLHDIAGEFSSIDAEIGAKSLAAEKSANKEH